MRNRTIVRTVELCRYRYLATVKEEQKLDIIENKITFIILYICHFSQDLFDHN